MALARALAAGADRTLRLGAVAPISGPYNMGGIQLPAMLSGQLDPYEATLGAAQWTVSWNRVYHFYDDPADAFQAPHHQTVEALFDSEHTLEEIFAELPGTPQELLTPQYIEQLTNPTGALAAAFAENDATCDWKPRVPARLYAASGDTSVPLANARHCQQAVRDRNGNIPVIDLGDINHVTSEQQAVPQIARWFTTVC